MAAGAADILPLERVYHALQVSAGAQVVDRLQESIPETWLELVDQRGNVVAFHRHLANPLILERAMAWLVSLAACG